jgi:N-acetylmuramoyl-L-alanine amidase
VLAVACLVAAWAGPAQAAAVRQVMQPDVIAVIQGGRQIFLEVRPPRGADAEAFYARYLANAADWTTYRNRVTAVAIPFAKLNAFTQREALEALFPMDYVDHEGWWHTVTFDGTDGAETWWSLAEWLTGVGTHYKTIQALPQNRKHTQHLRRGQVILVPLDLLKPEFKAPSMKLLAELGDVAPPAPPMVSPAPEPPAPRDAPPAESATDTALEGEDGDEEDHTHVIPAATGHQPTPEEEDDRSAPPPADATDLEYGKDAKGAYAAYRLKPGESLYSGVVVRFTDFRENADIHAACAKVQSRSGIADPRKISAGQRILIPLDIVADRYQPQDSEQRLAYEAVRDEARRISSARTGSAGLEGVVVILDPGLGGRDHGAAVPAEGIYEDEITYDLCVRMKLLLERDTRAKVYLTLNDPDQGHKPTQARRFVHDTDEYLLTTPHYKNQDARISANLRWYIANDILRKVKKQGVKDENVVFISMHCDALFNERLRGAMVYIPGAQYRRESERPSAAIYASYAEVRVQPEVSTTSAIRRRDEASSRAFAEAILRKLRTNNPPIKVHDAGDPIRNVIRQAGGRAYVPAVLRNTQVPTKVLVEAMNLTNPTDRKRAADPEWRQWFAEAMVNAIREQYGKS